MSLSFCTYIYIYMYMYVCICMYIYMKNKQHFNKNISATAFINSCQRLQFIHNAYNYEIPKDNYRYQETRYYLQ